MPEVKTITLNLAGWQKRMLRDYVRTTIPIEMVQKIKVAITNKKFWVMYRQPMRIPVNKGAWNLYLTDAQIDKVSTALGGNVTISALMISPEMIKSGQVVFL